MEGIYFEEDVSATGRIPPHAPWNVEEWREKLRGADERISPTNEQGIKKMQGSSGNLALQIQGNQEDELPPGGCAESQAIEKHSDSRGDFGEISAQAMSR